MKTHYIDNELYLDLETKVFFDDEDIPKEFKDGSKYSLVILSRSGIIRSIGKNIYNNKKEFTEREKSNGKRN